MKRKYSVILGNMGNTCDRFCSSGYKSNPDSMTMLKQAAAIPHVEGIELVGTWDIRPDNAREMKKALGDLGLTCVSIIPDLFADKIWWKGSFTSKDATVRRKAFEYTCTLCEVARELHCKIINLWPGQDGYDYLFTADYDQERAWETEAVAKLAEKYADLDFALEYKPKEPRTHSYLARMADALLVALETGQKNVGVTIDTGHAFVAGEVVAESIVLAKRAGQKLMHMHFNDNFTAWDDDMIVGSVHSTAYLEILYYLDKCNYTGWLSMDQYPYREDAAGAIGESIEWLVKFDTIVQQHKAELDRVIALGDAVETSRLLRKIL